MAEQTEVKHIIAVVGDQYNLSDEYSQPKVTFLRNQSAEEMALLFRETDMAFLSASTVCLEALSQQTSVFLGYYVDNQKGMYAGCISENLAFPLGNLLKLDVPRLDYSMMVEKAKSLKKVTFSLIPFRYKMLFHNLFLYWNFCKNGFTFVDYRLLNEDQHSLVWRTRNDDRIRSQMEHKELITWDAHLKFVKKLFSQYHKIYMGVYRDGKLVGSVNVEYKSVFQVERGIFVLPEYWGGGDSMLIEQTLWIILKEQGVNSIEARVLKSNERSFCFHLKAGYRPESNDGKYDYLTKALN